MRPGRKVWATDGKLIASATFCGQASTVRNYQPVTQRPIVEAGMLTRAMRTTIPEFRLTFDLAFAPTFVRRYLDYNLQAVSKSIRKQTSV